MFLQTKFENKFAAVKRYQESLSPEEKAQVLVTNATEQQNYQQSLSPESKFKYYAIMLMHTGNNASLFLRGKR